MKNIASQCFTTVLCTMHYAHCCSEYSFLNRVSENIYNACFSFNFYGIFIAYELAFIRKLGRLSSLRSYFMQKATAYACK